MIQWPTISSLVREQLLKKYTSTLRKCMLFEVDAIGLGKEKTTKQVNNL